MNTALPQLMERFYVALPELISDLPVGIELFHMNERVLFAAYGATGGVCSCWVVYLVKRGSGPFPIIDMGLSHPVIVGDWKFYGVIILLTDTISEAHQKILNAAKEIA